MVCLLMISALLMVLGLEYLHLLHLLRLLRLYLHLLRPVLQFTTVALVARSFVVFKLVAK
jgi:hypothetical protein